ncbi:hypothetical protein PCASD_04641 [Puccinia coronata f. sp. avenae]|uniref:No apical meristem-associated C-terminal domain-containing protein n=1 Tax=Puccinia coronata f. sp. avenae TaxID=200324 RepID=A0A2N5UXK7_9BASI|nr:hypothetical protein PCASD_04641 [Puccinia coronata f. sp. avenae]
MEQGNGNPANGSSDQSDIEGQEEGPAGGVFDLDNPSSASDDESNHGTPQLPLGQRGDTSQQTSNNPRGPAVETVGSSQGQNQSPANARNPHASWRPSSACAPLQALGSSARKRKTYAEQIASKFLSSKRDMAADQAASNDLAKHIAESDAKMAQAASDVARQLCSRGINSTSSDPKLRELHIWEKELDVKRKELEFQQLERESARQKLKGNVYKRAKMMQDFIKAGLGLKDTDNATVTCLGPPTQEAESAAKNTCSKVPDNVDDGSQQAQQDSYDLD